MRALAACVVIVVGCQSDRTRAPEPAPAPAPRDAAPAPRLDARPDAVLIDAVLIDAAPIDAAPVDAPIDADHTFDIYHQESIGPLRPGIGPELATRVLGEPDRKDKPTIEGASGNYVTTWSWSDASITMYGDRAKGPWKARDVSVWGRPTLETKKHIHVGSTRAEVERAYTRAPDAGAANPDTYLVGSVYGGLLFSFDHDRVSHISIGVFAF